MSDNLDESFITYEDSIKISKLMKITKFYSEIWNEFRAIINKNVNETYSEVTKAGEFEFNGKKYLILSYATMKYMIIDMDNNYIVSDYNIILNYLDKDERKIFSKTFNAEIYYSIIKKEDLINKNLKDIVDFVKKYPFLLENIDFMCYIKCDSGCGKLFFDISIDNFTLFFEFNNGEKVCIYLDNEMNIENKDNLSSIPIYDYSLVSESLKNMDISTSDVPKIYLKDNKNK